MNVRTIKVGFIQDVGNKGWLVHVDRNIAVCIGLVGKFNTKKMAERTMELYFILLPNSAQNFASSPGLAEK